MRMPTADRCRAIAVAVVGLLASVAGVPASAGAARAPLRGAVVTAPAGCKGTATAAWDPRSHVNTAARGEIAMLAAWVRSAQLPDGAIEESPGATTINPYLGSYGAAGLAIAYRATGDGADLVGAWRWLDWYANHEQRGTGFVTDRA